MVSVVLVIGLFNLVLGFGLAVMLEKQIVIPIPQFSWRRSEPDSGTEHNETPEPILPVSDEEVDTELIPATWLQVFEGSDLEIVARLEQPIRTICANIAAYREAIVQTEDVLHHAMQDESPETCTDTLENLVQKTTEWVQHANEAKDSIEDEHNRFGDYEKLAERLQRLLTRQAAGLVSKSKTVAARWQQGQHEEAITVLGEIAASLYRLRDVVTETLVIIMRDENQLDVFDRRQHYDVLTRLHNRLGVELVFRNWRHQEVNAHRTLSVALLDIDRFTDINRLLSTRTGDRVLGVFGRLLDALLTNDFGLYHVFRLSGQQFLAFFADTPVDDAARLVEEIRHGIEATRFVVRQRTVNLTVTACVTDVPLNSSTRELFGRLAGLCELAKQTGQNRTYLGHDSELELVAPTDQPAETREVRVV